MPKKPNYSVRRAPPLADAFVSLGAAPPEAEITAPPAPRPVVPNPVPLRAEPLPAQDRPARGWKVEARQDGQLKRKQTFYLDAAVSKRLAVFCAMHERDISGVVNEAILRLLSAEEGR